MEVKRLIKLDYSLQSPEERKALVEQFLEENPSPSEKQLEYLSDYLILCMEKQERKERKILTDNRMTTVNKRELSFEGLSAQFENGEDGIYNLVTEDKNVIFQPKISITKEDLEEIPFLKQIKEAIQMWEQKLKTATGKSAYIIKKAIIELRKDQYIIKNAYRKPISLNHTIQSKHYIPLDDDVAVGPTGELQASGVSLLRPQVCEAILCNYSKLKQDSYDAFQGDLWHLMQDFDNICGKALENYPLYDKIVECKIDGLQNIQIQEIIEKEFGIKHSVEYISTLWRKKIPQIIAAEAEHQYLDWYYLTQKKGKYKKCSRCGQIKLAHSKYFSKNNTSKDGFYSICKKCRNKKK